MSLRCLLGLRKHHQSSCLCIQKIYIQGKNVCCFYFFPLLFNCLYMGDIVHVQLFNWNAIGFSFVLLHNSMVLLFLYVVSRYQLPCSPLVEIIFAEHIYFIGLACFPLDRLFCRISSRNNLIFVSTAPQLYDICSCLFSSCRWACPTIRTLISWINFLFRRGINDVTSLSNYRSLIDFLIDAFWRRG
jgi:hypothetical protein